MSYAAAGTLRRSLAALRRPVAVFLLMVCAASSHLTAQTVSFGCSSPELFERLAGQGGVKAFTDIYLRPGGISLPPNSDALMLGALKSKAPSGRFGPAFGKCDPVTDNSVFQIQQLFPPGNQNVSGAVSGGVASGGSTPFARIASARTASSDVVVGFVDRGDFTPFQAFRWTAATGLTYLGTLDAPNNANRTSMATSTDSTGTVVVGFSQIGAGTTQHGFRWTSAGMTDLGSPAGPTRDSRALDVSASGTVIVGDATFPDQSAFTGFRSGAFRWTAAQGFQDLGALAPGFPSIATAVSADGAVVVGQGGLAVQGVNATRAFRWTTAGGLQVIAPLAGHTGAIATGVSDNGNVVVGISGLGNPSYNPVLGYFGGTAFRWTAAGGTQDLKQLLVSTGLDLSGINLVSATAVSEDGQWIVGDAVLATTPPGETRPYFAKYCDAAIGGPCTPFRKGTPAPVATFDLSTSSPTAQSVAAGSSATATLTVTPSGAFSQPVTFACSGLPTLSACQFAPSTLTPASAAVSTTLTISTTAPTRGGSVVSTLASDGDSGLLMLALLGVVGVRWRRWSRWRIGWRHVRLSAGAVAVAASCSGGGDGGTSPPPPPLTGGTPAGTFPIVVTATSGSGTTAISRSLTVTLTVTR